MAKTPIHHEDLTSKKALLIATFSGSREKATCEEHLSELSLLAQTFGVDTAQKVPVPLRKIEAATLIGSGKLEELKLLLEELRADLVIFDEEITPAQQRNLEKIFGKPVMDRTELILGVFAQRARTKEARLQIELAEVKYQLPRLKRLWTHLSRQTGSGGTGVFAKGEGEKQIELDKRMLRDRIDWLQNELKDVAKYRHTQRAAREKSEVPLFAIVGYTNAGKSTLMNALTDAGVFVEDKLFATLDTTTRKYALPNNQEILLIDTVGFIRKLPHLLVAAFKSTLEEALHADILLHLIDVSHPMAQEQAEASYAVLKELNAMDKPVITILNKIDQIQDPSVVFKFKMKYPRTIAISAIQRTGFEELQEVMIEEIRKRRRLVWLKIPQKDYKVIAEVIQQGVVLNQEYDENDVLLRAEIPVPLFGRLQKYVVNDPHP